MDGKTTKQFRATYGRSSPSPEIPPIGREYWGYFFELHRARSYSDGGPNAINFQSIDAWMRLTQRDLSPREVGIIRAMDMEFIATYADVQRESAERKKQDDKLKGL